MYYLYYLDIYLLYYAIFYLLCLIYHYLLALILFQTVFVPQKIYQHEFGVNVNDRIHFIPLKIYAQPSQSSIIVEFTS